MDWKLYFVQGMELLFLGIGSYFDMKNREIPLAFLGISGAAGILCNLFWEYQSVKNIVLGVCVGGIFLVLGWITRESIGYGDGMGLTVLGIFAGWQGMIPIVVTAFLLSGVYGLWRVIGLKRPVNDTMAFYPFLFLAFMGVIVL